MTHFKVQEWPDMPGDGGAGDAIVFSSEWPAEDWERITSPYEAWCWLGGNTEPGDTIEVLAPVNGVRDDSYAGP